MQSIDAHTLYKKPVVYLFERVFIYEQCAAKHNCVICWFAGIGGPVYGAAGCPGPGYRVCHTR